METLLKLIKKCRASGSIWLIVILKYFFFKIKGKNILSHQNASIKGVKNITTAGVLQVGISYVGFIHKSVKTYLNIEGRINFEGNYSIGRGCAFDIGSDAVVNIGKGGYMNANCKVIIMHNLQIGDNCAIAWDCQFLDEDFHHLDFENRKKKNNEIIIGDNVWIGCGTFIYKGSVVPDGCVIAANSVIRDSFTERNVLIAGNPAKIIKSNVTWIM